MGQGVSFGGKLTCNLVDIVNDTLSREIATALPILGCHWGFISLKGEELCVGMVIRIMAPQR